MKSINQDIKYSELIDLISSHTKTGEVVYYYVKNDYEVEVVPTRKCKIEILHISLIKPIHVILVYNPLNTSHKLLLNALQENINECKKEEVCILGDFNINLLKHDNQSRKLSQITTDHNLSQLIKESTRVTTNTSTLIDHLYTNRPPSSI